MHAIVDGQPPSATDIANSSSASVLSASPPPTVSVSGSPNEPGLSPLRRLKSKSSLWSVGSSNHDDESALADPTSTEKDARPSIFRRLSPALAARVKLLDGGSKVTSAPRNPNNVGRIPEQHLKVLDSLHQDLSIRVERKGQAWSGVTQQSPSGSTHSQERCASNRLELPCQDILREVSEARERGSEHPDAVVDDPEPPVLAVAHPPVAAPEAVTSSPPTSMSVAEPAPAHQRTGPDSEPDVPPNGHAQDTRTDFEKYVEDTKRSEEQSAPAPPPKDSPPADSFSSSSNTQSYFNPHGLQRAESIYSFSRASFSNQLSQLTSIPLPQPAALETSIANIATALAAVRALNGAAEQIQIWIRKASDVLNGLDSEDDVEWAAAGGREGLDGVDKAITRFECLVNVYVKAIENVQLRDDIANVDPQNLKTIVNQMESILQNWAQIKLKLKGVKEQVELAMEWEELWSNVLGDVGMEIDNLSGMIFEMEEKRHQALMDTGAESTGGLDINELETIVEESPTKGRSPANNRLSIGPMLAAAAGTPVIKTPQDDSSYSNLMALFARMQPLRASLDFLPMRLSMFQSRAEGLFPSACEELDDRRDRLEKSYKVLEQDAEALRKELGEDKWIIVFRNAGSQAQKMFDSVERSIAKLQEGLETNAQVHSPATLTKRIENYEAKKMHYVPAIERVVSIIQKGVNDRLTVNGEVLRLLSDMTSRTDALKASLKVMDSSLEEVHIVKGQQLRDSISSILTVDSPATGSAIETPGSSPASSVVLNGNGYKGGSTPLGGSSRRESSVGSATTRSTMSKVRRYSGLPQATASLTGRKSSIPKPSGLGSPTPSTGSHAITPTPASRRVSRVPQPSTIPDRPRWNGSTNLRDLDTGHNFKPLSTATPSTYRKSSAPVRTPRPASTTPFRRDMSASPAPSVGRPISRLSTRLASSSRSPVRNISSPTPARSSLLDPPPYSRLRRPSGLSNASGITNTPRSRQSFAGVGSSFSRSVSHNQDPAESPSKSTRPGTALGHSGNRRTSLLPLPKRNDKEKTPAQKKLDARPPWRA
ncbi:uncharacterized protein N7459_001265 [Penicillium hispanicum]|uniref:uncharacterized protein n=1 Tax=Penicillium hispanicum TaxID=1080232 RepID=UPI0025413777|nr:uncharacterized protein N7459_001265 [Penicillium hispanicum]KAJ5595057.1 hypothetical protein N7459_001265 [Penicillium hispanicum]